MPKTVFQHGTPVTPDWLNAINNPVFDGQDLDGHRPQISDGELDSSTGSVKSRVETIADWLKVEHTSGLGVQWKPATLRISDGTLIAIPANTTTLPDNATTYFYVVNGGATLENGAALPANSLQVAKVVTVNGAVTEITDLRSAHFVPFDEIHGTLSQQTQALRDADTALQSGLTSLQSSVTTAEGEIDALQSGLTTAQADITTLQSSVTTAESEIDALQSSVTALEGQSGLADYTIETAAAFTITPTAKVAYNGTADATATIAAGTTPGQSIELLNISDSVVTIAAAGLAIDGATLQAGEGIKYLWDGSGEYEPVAVASGGTIPEGGGGSLISALSSWVDISTSWDSVVQNATGGAYRSVVPITDRYPGVPTAIDNTLITGSNELMLFEGSTATRLTPQAGAAISLPVTPQIGSVLIDGRVLISGGDTGGIYLINPDNTVSTIPMSGRENPIIFATEHNGAILSFEGKYPTDVYRFDLNTEQWEFITQISGGYNSSIPAGYTLSTPTTPGNRAFWAPDESIWVYTPNMGAVTGTTSDTSITSFVTIDRFIPDSGSVITTVISIPGAYWSGGAVNPTKLLLNTIGFLSSGRVGFVQSPRSVYSGGIIFIDPSDGYKCRRSKIEAQYAQSPDFLSLLPLPDGRSLCSAGGALYFFDPEGTGQVSTYLESAGQELSTETSPLSSGIDSLTPEGDPFSFQAKEILGMNFSVDIPLPVLMSKFFNQFQ